MFYWLTVAGGPRRIIVPNFIKIGRFFAEMWFCEFSKWRPPPSWIFEIAKFYWLLGSTGWRRISLPNFVKIGQSVAKILRFFDFSRWRPSAILDLFGAHLDHPQWVLWGLYHSAKFGYGRYSSFIIWTFQNLARLAGKSLFTPQKLGFWAIWSHKWATISIKAKKAHPCVSPRHLSH